MNGQEGTGTASVFVGKALLRYIIPFRIDLAQEGEGSFGAVCGRLASRSWAPITEFDPNHHLYDHILSGLRPESGAPYLGRAWSWQDPKAAGSGLRVAFTLPGDPEDRLLLKNVSLALFTTGVGFLWYDVRRDPSAAQRGPRSLENLLRLHQQLGNISSYNRRHVQFTDGGEPYQLAVWVRDLLSAFLGPVRFFNSLDMDGSGPPLRALRFAYAVLEGEDGIPLTTRVCQLARGFASLSVPGQDLARQSLEAFQGTCIHIAREGCAYVSSSAAPEFNRKHFLSRFETCYFWIYLLTLQQSYALKDFARRIAESAGADPAERAGSMDRLLAEISSFLVRNEFAGVSDAHHINEFYCYGLSQLNIREESVTLHDSLNALTQLQNSIRQAREAKREKEADARVEFGLALLAFLAVISALCDSVGVITGILDEHLRGIWWIPVALLWLLVAGIVALAVRLLRGRDLPRLLRKGRKSGGED